MITTITITAASLTILVGLAAVFAYRFLHPSPERRRVQIMTDELIAESQVDALTRATIQAMRDAVRAEIRRGIDPR